MKDKIYAKKKSKVENFKFDLEVSKVFDDMIMRSVPGYQEIVNLTGSLASMHIKANSNVYDLGCSLGAASLAIRAHTNKKHVKLIAVDSSAEMLKVCEKNLAKQKSDIPFELLNQDITEVTIDKASVVVMNFTLQFIPPRKRLAILRKIHNGLKPGGALIIAEKTIEKSRSLQKRLDRWHSEFKKAHGYSELEIAQKRSALENVLVSETEETHIRRLRNAGFKYVQKWFQAYNFKAFIAFKGT